MKVLIPGHKYVLSNIKPDDGDRDINTLKFYYEKGKDRYEVIGTSNQEVIRVLIDRVKYLENELHHPFNKDIIHHLRMALSLHEARHLTRIVDKDIAVEEFPVGNDGHFICLDKEKEYFYQDEIVQNDYIAYPDSRLTDVKEDTAEGLNNIIAGDKSTSSLPQDEVIKHCDQILKNKKDLSRGKETSKETIKRFFKEPTAMPILKDKDILNITNAADQDLLLANIKEEQVNDINQEESIQYASDPDYKYPPCGIEKENT